MTDNNSKLILNITENDISSGKTSGGQTGSLQIKRDGQFYQYKQSILASTKTLISGIKSGIKNKTTKSLDSTNYGEFLAGTIAREALISKDSGPELSPLIQLTDRPVFITSRYLESEREKDGFKSFPQELKDFAKNATQKQPIDLDNIRS
jgi:hypothetical protein